MTSGGFFKEVIEDTTIMISKKQDWLRPLILYKESSHDICHCSLGVNRPVIIRIIVRRNWHC